jgi:hypothetical protein
MMFSYIESEHQKYLPIGFSLIASQVPKNSALIYCLSSQRVFHHKLGYYVLFCLKKERKKERRRKPLFL